MDWIKTSEKFPPVDSSTGESEYVLVMRCDRCLPICAKYSDGTYSKQGWWTTSFEHIPIHTGKGANRKMSFVYWSTISYPHDITKHKK